MVIKKEISSKKGIFADYQIDNAVRSNEQQLEDEEVSEINASSEYVNDDIFRDFNLDEIVKENEEHANAKRRRLKEKEKAAVTVTEIGGGQKGGGDKKRNNVSSDGDEKNDNETNSNGNGNGNGNRLRSFILRNNKGKSNNSNNDADANNNNNNQGGGEGEEYETTSTTATETGGGGGGTARRLLIVQNHRRKMAKVTNTSSRSGTTITTVPEEDEHNHDGGGGGGGEDYYDDDDDDDSAVNFTGAAEEGRRREGRFAGGGGGVPSNTDPDWWISPHSADTIFSDFNLDAIVEDYEKLQRKINYQPGTTSKTDNKKYCDDNDVYNDDTDYHHDQYDLNNKTFMGINVRYKSIKKFWLDNLPRTHGILCRVLIPLWIMVLITVLLGIVLARFEINGEIEENNTIMRGKYELSKYPYDETLNFLFGLPTVCFDYYLYKKQNETDTNYTMDGLLGGMTHQDMLDATFTYNKDTVANLTTWVGDRFPPVEVGYDTDDPSITVSEIREYLEICENAGVDLIQNFVEITSAIRETASINAMSFNWMRCWNTDELGSVNPIRADSEQLDAAGNQTAFYDEMWLLDQQKLYELYLNDSNCTSDVTCQKDAHEKSIVDATGADMCDINVGASAWFWFVFMTTVGYGNQSPSTTKGRLLVGMLGWLLIICWAMILFVAGKVLGIVIDDILRRCRCRSWTGDIEGVIVWGFIAGCWIFVVGSFASVWFNYTHDPDTFEIFQFWDEKSLSLGDAFWFSYISLLTVGLGDFYLESRYLFISDLGIWTALFLVGFTFLSTFLGQVADLMSGLFPDSGDALRERLMNTKLVGRKEVQYKKENEKGISKLEKLVEMMDDDDIDIVTQRVSRIREKKYILAHLLYQTKLELEYYKKRGEKYENLSYSKICEEENMLNEVLANTAREREKIETYRDGRSTTEVSSTPNVAHSFLEESTSTDDIESKLQVRKKRFKRSNAASLYL